jgi:hypothetical protein
LFKLESLGHMGVSGSPPALEEPQVIANSEDWLLAPGAADGQRHFFLLCLTVDLGGGQLGLKYTWKHPSRLMGGD